jgi:hypothetical protein
MIRSVQLQYRRQFLTLNVLQNMAQPKYLKTSVLTCNKMKRQQLQRTSNMAVTVNTAFKYKHNNINTLL